MRLGWVKLRYTLKEEQKKKKKRRRKLYDINFQTSSYISAFKAVKSWHPFTLIHVHCFPQRVKITSLFYRFFSLPLRFPLLSLLLLLLPLAAPFYIFDLRSQICWIRFILAFTRQLLSKVISFLLEYLLFGKSFFGNTDSVHIHTLFPSPPKKTTRAIIFAERGGEGTNVDKTGSCPARMRKRVYDDGFFLHYSPPLLHFNFLYCAALLFFFPFY